MTITELVSVLTCIPRPQDLDPDNDGSCSCFVAQYVIDGKLLSIQSRCYWVAEQPDVRVWGDFPEQDLQSVADTLKQKLDPYGNHYTVSLTSPRKESL